MAATDREEEYNFIAIYGINIHSASSLIKFTRKNPFLCSFLLRPEE